MITKITSPLAVLSAACILITGYACAQSTEKALVFSPSDADIAWGPCPEFMPASCQLAVLHGDPAQKNADVFFKVPGDTRIPSHWHTSAERMVLVSGEMEVTYEGQETVVIKTGDYAYGPAGMPHDAYCRTGDACVLYIGFIDPVDAMATEAGD